MSVSYDTRGQTGSDGYAGRVPAIAREILLAGAGLIALTLIFRNAVNWNFFTSLDFGVVWQYRAAFLRGVAVTLGLTLLTMIVATLGGILAAAAAQSRWRIARFLILSAVQIFRSVPILITLFWIHFVTPLLTGVSLHVLVSGFLAMVLQAAAFMTEVMRAGIAAVPKGQSEASNALGLSTLTRWNRIIIPQAISIMLPSVTNVLMSMMKASAILSALSVEQLWQVAQQVGSYTFKPIEALTVAALIYFLLGKLLSITMRLIEAKASYPR